MVQAWILNSCNTTKWDELETFMLCENIACFGLGSPLEKRECKNGNTTYKQYQRFLNDAQIGDIIYLYRNGCGIIAYAYYNGKISREEGKKGPWELEDEIQITIGINYWFKVKPYYLGKKAPRFTLSKTIFESSSLVKKDSLETTLKLH